jgi:hypothetical protein
VAGANNSGAIHTSKIDGTVVNGNIYDAKGDVYMNGGPQNPHDAGLVPEGVYYFMVTDPSGAVLLSNDDISCRQVIVSGTHIQSVPLTVPGSCTTGFHTLGTVNPNGGTPVQIAPFDDTPNAGGEYKVWLTPVENYSPDANNPQCSAKGAHVRFGFCDSDSKTDNFKLKVAGVAHVSVCKFNDWNGDGAQNGSEPNLEHWPITATGVDGDTVNTQTDDNGCVSFDVSNFNGQPTRTVTLTEGNEGPDWTQTAPAAGPCTGIDGCTVANGVITLTLKPDDNIQAPNFGNANPYCPDGCFGNTLVVTKDANPSLKRTYQWTIDKSVDQAQINTASTAIFNYTVNVAHDAGTDSDWQVSGGIRVANPTPDVVTGLNVSDVIDNQGACTVTGGTGVTVAAGSHVDLPYTCTYEGAPTPAGTNTATAAWEGGVQSGTASFDFAKATIATVDGTIDVTDSLAGDLGTVSAIDDPSPKTFTYSQTFTDTAGTCTDHENIASFTGKSGATGSAKQTVKVCVGADLTISKTAAATFDSRITKDVDKTKVEQADGNITFNYTIKVNESSWQVAGKVTVFNPNDWETVTADLSDVFSDSAASCQFTGGNVVSIPPATTVELPYTCTYGGPPATTSGTNTATLTWDPAAAFTPNGTAAGTASYAFSALTVKDSYKGDLGTISTPAALTTYTYARTIKNATGGTCSSYDNTATIVETNQTASQTVTVCNTNTGALTIGFWQNKNGQGLITTAGPATTGVCSLTTWLRNYTPFQDLPATSTCSQAAAYITKIIKAANASGASMNAMLKAQMLATSLDVYFSTPGLGGNRIAAPTPIGNVKIDLTKVCSILDNSLAGAGSCSGSYQSASSAFGGATSMYVKDMLAFQNTVANSGGILWYGNVKAMQGLAKNAFDAINNRAAWIAP